MTFSPCRKAGKYFIPATNDATRDAFCNVDLNGGTRREKKERRNTIHPGWRVMSSRVQERTHPPLRD